MHCRRTSIVQSFLGQWHSGSREIIRLKTRKVRVSCDERELQLKTAIFIGDNPSSHLCFRGQQGFLGYRRAYLFEADTEEAS